MSWHHHVISPCNYRVNWLTFVVQPFDRRCRVLPNDTVSCDSILYQDPLEWKNHKEKLDEMIEEYRKMLEDLRVCTWEIKGFFSAVLKSFKNKAKNIEFYLTYYFDNLQIWIICIFKHIVRIVLKRIFPVYGNLVFREVGKNAKLSNFLRDSQTMNYNK